MYNAKSTYDQHTVPNCPHCTVLKRQSAFNSPVLLSRCPSLFLPSTLHHRLWRECALLICWTDCWRESCNQLFVIYLSFSPALMQLETRSRLFEFLAHGLVSWKWELFCINLFEGAGMQIVATSCRTWQKP